jgi:N-acyl-D-aspartate/D-glutamate deacylase
MLDLLVRGGTVVDGSGAPRFRADVGVRDGRIVDIGRIRDAARRTLDADGLVVAPGFIDGHTHMDAQVFWDPVGSCSSYHGVTTAIMGNCGFTLAPCAQADADLVFRNLERAEDIAREALLAGVRWTWESFPQYLDAVDAVPKGINYGVYIGHSALRTYVMGARAFAEAATDDELARMCQLLREALQAGAIGLSTSRSANHTTPDHEPVASRLASWQEVCALVNTMGEMNRGIFEIAHEPTGRSPERRREYFDRLKALAVESGRPITFGTFSAAALPDAWRDFYALLDETAAAGGRMFSQCHSRSLSVLLSFETHTPFDRRDGWRALRALPLAEQQRQLADPAVRARLVEAANAPHDGRRAVGTEARQPNWDMVFAMAPDGSERPMSAIARERGVTPVEVMLDIACERGMKAFFRQPIANENQDHVLEMMRHPRSVVTFSDSGAHVSQIMDASLQSHVLAHWVREKQALSLEQAVRRLSFDIASAWGLNDRGLLREGMAADLVVFDPATVRPKPPEVVHDLPAGGRRLKQTCAGMRATVVNGRILLEDDAPTGECGGVLLRGARPRAA